MGRRIRIAFAFLGVLVAWGCGGADASGGASGGDAAAADVRSASDLFLPARDAIDAGAPRDASKRDGGAPDDATVPADAVVAADAPVVPDSASDTSPVASDTRECVTAADCEAARDAPFPCFAWVCADGTCVERPVADGAPCDDGDACTADDRCAEGACGGAAVRCEDDGSPCTLAVCDPDEGCVAVAVTGLACDDGDACTESDRCVRSKCIGEPARCDDGDPCTADRCDPLVGCVSEGLPGAPCDDGDPCTAGDACAEAGCVGVPLDCDDGDPCTRDACDPATGACASAPATGPPCDDGSACTTGDHCESGRCGGRAIACDDGNPCTDDDCDAVAGCRHGPADGAPCNDGNACTDVDRCAAGACVGQATACDDGDPCTEDSCTFAGGCVHRQPGGLPCDDGDACTTGDRCYRGACEAGASVDCDDGDPCTADTCDPGVGCGYTLLGGTPCDDADACTADDRCEDGTCRGVPIVCDDASPCTADACDPAVGCVFDDLAIPCDDGDPCTAGDFCESGLCRPGRDPECLAVERVVLGGDSWSAGFIYPLRDALDARGYEEVTVTWELTAKPGSTVAGWLADPGLMAGLYASLDADPPAEILFFTLGGNDYLGACRGGLGLFGPLEWFLTMARIQWDLQTFVALAKAGRPNLKVVLIGYDYLNFFVIQAFGIDFPGMDWIRFNLGLVDLASRGRDAAAATDGMLYAHNMGLLQHTFGDGLFGYGPGVAPKPGPAPTYDPFPGGWYTYPSPAAHIPDGVHPDYDGFRALIENSLDQGPAAWIEGRPWP